jgi:hypothetical protein
MVPGENAQDMGTVDTWKARASARAAPANISGKAVRTDDIEAMLPALERAIAELR